MGHLSLSSSLTIKSTYERKQVVQRLVELLRDPHRRVRKAAIAALFSLNEVKGGVKSLVEGTLVTFAEQDRPRL